MVYTSGNTSKTRKNFIRYDTTLYCITLGTCACSSFVLVCRSYRRLWTNLQTFHAFLNIRSLHSCDAPCLQLRGQQTIRTRIHKNPITKSMQSQEARGVASHTKNSMLKPKNGTPRKLLSNQFCIDSAHFFIIEKVSVVPTQEYMCWGSKGVVKILQRGHSPKIEIYGSAV